MSKIVILGPQRYQPTIGQEIETAVPDGDLAVITAGWQERESEMADLDAAVGRPTVNLRLHARAEEIFRDAPEFREAHRNHQNRIKTMQAMYRVKLHNALASVEELKHMADVEEDILEPQVEDALEVVRHLDRHHLETLAEANREFYEERGPKHSSSIMDHHYEVAELIDRSSAVLVAGGHVAVLLNRLRLLKLEGLLRNKPLVAWSAGAMVLCDRVVLFHDSPPQGPGNAEIFEAGLGLYDNMIPLPHASRRLVLDDPVRVSTLASRFSGSACLALNDNTRIDWDGETWHNGTNIKRLTESGSLESWGRS